MNTIVVMAISFGFVGLLVVLLLRYGPVDHSWVKLEKEQIKRLKAAHKAYRRSHAPARPMGRPLYKRRILSHEGLAIFQNGLYAKFCVGRKGRYRFVPFEEISGIYPVKMENPLTKKDSRWLGLSSWKALQIETESSMVLLVQSIRHKFDEVVPALKRGMGDRWDRLYHPEEVLWSNLMEGEAMIHKSIRGERPAEERPARPDLFVDVEPKVLPSTTGKGRLLLEESGRDYESRSKSFAKGAMILLPLAVGIMIAGVYLLLLDIPFFGIFLALILLFPGILLVMVSALLYAASKKRLPLRIYENGFEVPLLLGKRTFFISYGEITGIAERRNFIDGDIWVFETGKPNQMIAVRKDMKGFDEVLKFIRSKIGRAEHIVELEPTKEEAAASRKLEYALYTTGFVLGIVVSLVITTFAFLGWPAYFFFFGLGLILPPLTMLTTTFMTFQMRKMKKLTPRRLNVKIPAIMVIGLLLYFLLNMLIGVQIGGISVSVEDNIEPRPTSSFLAPGTYEGEFLIAEGSILVESGNSLILRNSTLAMNLSEDREFGIWVEEGGTLVMENCTVESVLTAFGYTFEIMGSAVINASDISGLWGDPDNENFEGGLEIYSSDVVIENTWIRDSRTNGILIMESDPLLLNVTIENALDDGIEMHKSRARVLNSTINGCDWAMIVSTGSEPLIKGNWISGNNHGIVVQLSDPIVEDNHFAINRDFAIMYDSYSNPTFSGNTFSGNDEDIVHKESSYYLEFCGIVTVGIAIACLLTLFWVYKESMKREY
ncbi:MAG: right-handed parallel beta-helix repeat-containing protein [Thermoplasmata archaeon]